MVAPFIKQLWIVSGVIINIIGAGMVLSYPSCLLPALKAPDSTIKVDLDTASWLASVVGLAGMIGFLGTSLLIDNFGRKGTFIVMLLPGILGWLLIYFSADVTTMMIGRVSSGATAGASFILGSIVIGEYTSPQDRGMFLNFKIAASSVGTLSMHVLGHFLNWRTVALFSIMPLVLGLCNILTWPESPSWQASKGKFKESEKSYKWLRGDSEIVMNEFKALVQAQNKRLSLGNTNKSPCTTKLVEFFKKHCRKDFVKPVMIMYFAYLLLEASGRHTFPAFALDILNKVSGNKSQTYMFTICIDLMNITSILFGSYLIKIVKRRKILFYSGFSSIAILSSISLYLYLASCGVISNNKAWIPLTMLIPYFIISNLGCTSIPLALLGEIFPLPHRSTGTLLSGVLMSICLSGLLKSTPILLETINTYGTFAVYSVIMLFAIVVLYIILPETKDRTLQEIEDYFNNGKFLDNEISKADPDAGIKMLQKDDKD